MTAKVTRHFRKLLVTSVYLAIPVIAYASYQLGNYSSNRVEPLPFEVSSGLAVWRDDLTVRDAPETTDFTHKVRVRNVTNQTIHIDSLTTGCNCLSAEPKAFSLGPGQEGAVAVRADLTPHRPDELPLARRWFRASVHWSGHYPDGTPVGGQFEWRALVTSAIQLSQRVLDYGDTVSVGAAPLVRTVRARCQMPDTRLVARSSAPTLCVALRGPEPDGEYQIDMHTSSDVGPGDHNWSVHVDAVDGSGTVRGSTSLVVRAEVLDRVRCVPRQSYLGVVASGKPIAVPLTLVCSPGGIYRPVRIEGSEAGPHDVSAELSGDFTETTVVRLTVTPRTAGDQLIPLRVLVRREHAGDYWVPAEIRLYAR